MKLATHVEDPAELEMLLDDLTSRGWLSDERAAAQLVRMKCERLGSARIRHALKERGVSEALIGPALAGLKETELDRARAVWARKFGEPPADSADRARQVRFLQSRGFSMEVALRVVRTARTSAGDESCTR